MSIDRFCKDCRWIVWHGHDANCGHLSARWHRPRSVVTGKAPAPVQLPCDEARGPNGILLLPDLCGPAGEHWEPAMPPGFV